MASDEPSFAQENAVPDKPVLQPHLTAIDSAPPRKTHPQWPAAILMGASGQLLFVTDREQWESDVGLQLQDFSSDDLMIDSLGRVFGLVSAQTGMVWAGMPRRSIKVIPQAKRVSTEDFCTFMRAHVQWSGLVADEVLPDIASGEQSIESLISHLVRTSSLDIPENESEFGEAYGPKTADGKEKDYEPPQFTIRTVFVILTIVAVGCSAVASNYFGFGTFKTLFIALFTCAIFLLLLWIVVGALTDSHE